MGLCGSSADAQAATASANAAATNPNEAQGSRALDQKIQDEKVKENAVCKLLLLGAGESGKSTIFKQLTTLYAGGYDEKSRLHFLPAIHNNILVSIITLYEQAGVLGKQVDASLEESFQQLKKCVPAQGEEFVLRADGAALVKKVWADAGIKETLSLRAKFQIPDSMDYFFNKVDDVASENYVPSYEDILRCRSRTTGITETNFQIGDHKFRLLDVGGQKNERKKWEHCFEYVTAVLFVVALSEYDQVLFEDNQTNRMQDALNLFQSICNSRWFQNTAMILFLNKRDLFEEKIKKINITTAFPEYSGPQEYKSAVEYVRDQFLKQSEHPDKPIYPHITCATDKNNVEFTFKAVKDIIIRGGLQGTGLLA